MNKYENLSLRRFLDVLMTPEGYDIDPALDMEPFLLHQAGHDHKKLTKIKEAIQERMDDYYQQNKIIARRDVKHSDNCDPNLLDEEEVYRRISRHASYNSDYDEYLETVMYCLRDEKTPDIEYYKNINWLEGQLHMTELVYIESLRDMVLAALGIEDEQDQSFCGFTTLMSENQVRYLYNALRANGYISTTMEEQGFFSAFQPMGYDPHRIIPAKVQWIGKKNEYAYFIKSLLSDEFNYIKPGSHWEITQICIGLPSYNNLAKLASAAPPASAHTIDNIIRTISKIE